MIKAIEIEGFRSLRSVRFELRPLNVLIGPNQSGKTNILDALDLLSRAVQGRLTDALYQTRGGLANLLWVGEGPRRIRYRIEYEPDGQFPKEYESFVYGLTIEERPLGHVVAEEFLKIIPVGAGHDVWTGFELNCEKGVIRIPSQETPIPLEGGSRKEPILKGIISLIGGAASIAGEDLPHLICIYPGFETKARWTCDHPNGTPQIRQPQFMQHVTLLDPQGDNLVNVLYALSQDEERWKNFKDVARIGFPDFENIMFLADAGQGRIALAWVDRRHPEKIFTAEMLSSGTLSFLAMSAALASPEALMLIGFDEPEANLHPELLYRMVGLMEQASASRQIIVATHSDALLSYLSDPTSVVIVNNGPQGTTLTRPPEADLHEWLKDYTLGQLREDGFLRALARVEG